MSLRTPWWTAGIAAGLLLSGAAAAREADPGQWRASWTASPVAPSPPFATLPVLSNQTVRQTVVLSAGGDQVRIRLSNEFGAAPVVIGAASIALAGEGEARRIPLTFSGQPGVEIAPGAPALSDPVRLQTPPGARLDIALFLPRETPITTFHPLGLDASAISGPGDFTRSAPKSEQPFTASIFPNNAEQFFIRPFLSEVDVHGPRGAGVVAALGDSITDGYGSSAGQARRWPDVLARRLAAAGRSVAVVNEGIGGNRLLADGLGASVLARLDRDVLALPGVETVVVMIGINDIGFSGGLVPGAAREVIQADALIAGYRQVIARAHLKGLTVIGATLTPFEGGSAYSPAKETVRQAVNAWIRSSGAFDSVIDFDAALRDPDHPSRLRARFDQGDHIHPSDAGYEAMGQALDLAALAGGHPATKP